MKKYILTLILICPLLLNAQIINTICGGYLGIGDSAKAIGLLPQAQVVDKSGNIYIADYGKWLIRKLSNKGIYSIVAGTGIYGFSGDGGKATAAQISYTYSLTLDDEGNLYFSDNSNARVRKINTNGIVTTIAGNGTYGFSGDSGLATAAEISGVDGIAIDQKGNIYLADLGNNRIRKIDKNGIITTIAGSSFQGTTGDGGPATLARLILPIGVTVDSLGELFIADVGANNIRKIDSNGIISTIAGSTDGQPGFSGDGGPATAARFNQIVGSVAVDGQGNIYIPDAGNNRIRKIDKNGIVNTVIGNGISDNTGDGGLAINASINTPSSVNVNSAGNIYIAVKNYVREVDVNNIIHTVAGNGSGGFNGDGILAAKSQLYEPRTVKVDDSNNVYLIDAGDYRVRKILPDGKIITVAGNGLNSGLIGDSGLATNATLGYILALAKDKKGNLYIADDANQSIRKVDGSGIITTIAGGNGATGFSGDGGAATLAQLSYPDGLAIDDTGNIYIADKNNQRIRKIDVNGIITTIAGNGTRGFSGDGGSAIAAELNYPDGLAIDNVGNILIADNVNNRVRKIDNNGIITTVAGNGTSAFNGDGGSATAAGLTAIDVAADSSGNILIADRGNDRIRKVDKNGIISTIAGGGNVYGDGGNPLVADLPGLYSVAVDKSGNVFISDFTNHRVRKITNGVLATTLLKFNAQLQNNNTTLNWQTASEVNTAYFNIQRSNDGVNFNTISKVTAAGNSASTKNYTYTDINATALHADKLYYRLQEVDKDSKSNYSNIQVIDFKKNNALFTISPNPANDFINIVASDNVANAQVSITDMNGRTLYTGKQNFTANQHIKIPASQFSKQVLIVTINTGNGKQEFKVVKE